MNNVILKIVSLQTNSVMSGKEKLKERFECMPADFTFDEVVRLFADKGFTLSQKGSTSGSRVAFVRGNESFLMHKPHPGNIVKKGTLKAIKAYFESKHLLQEWES
jgi:predicted RNA binding protein YcfA (HicA-like mRNA interferase family)